MTLLVRPAAAADLEDAYGWYEARSSGLGEGFLVAVQRTFEKIQESPHGYEVLHRQTRRALVHRFPYGVLYRVREHNIVVVACLHAKRDPRRWRSRS